MTTTVASALPGSMFPLGAGPTTGGTNFAVASGAEAVRLCLFDDGSIDGGPIDGSGERQVELTEYDAGVWHGFVPGVGPGQAYGYRMSGPWDPRRGLRYNPAKLLLDPYARAISGEVRFGPEVLAHRPDDPYARSDLESAAHVPRSLVIDTGFRWSERPRPRRRYSDTILYEVHVKGFTRATPTCPPRSAGPTPASGTTLRSPTWSASA